MFSLQAIYSEMLHIYVANNSMFLMQTNSFSAKKKVKHDMSGRLLDLYAQIEQ